VVAERVRPYLFYDVALSICAVCYRKVEGKILFEDGKVLLTKLCPEHGAERVLVADDVEYYKRCREIFLKKPEQPAHYNTPVRFGCPYDCGLCPDHEQHSCVAVVEVADHCNLRCPICYAGSGPHRPELRSLEQIEFMLDAVVRNEREPDIVQLSGGEPTIHPQFFDILAAARRRPIKHVMVITNGVRLAQDEAFARRLAEELGSGEIYLQFDSFERDALLEIRGADLRAVRRKALDRCNELRISTTLEATLKKGTNDHEIGRLIEFALEQPCVRGVSLQPVQAAGRLDAFDPARDRLTLTEVRRKVLEQTSVFRAEDVLPVPCHPDSIAMAFALKQGGRVTPLTGLFPPEVLIEGGRNTVLYRLDERVPEALFGTLSTGHSPEGRAATLRQLLCCLPQVPVPATLGYENVFRLIILQLMDAHAFDVRSVKKSCIHIVHTDGRLIPVDTYNLFYRDDLEATRLAALRAQIPAPVGPRRLPLAP
jgi:uncharacterized radical SAM superfamily Fe-S cluster-containing enzyme